MRCARCLKNYPEKEMVVQLGTKICVKCVKRDRKMLWIVLAIIFGIILLPFLILLISSF